MTTRLLETPRMLPGRELRPLPRLRTPRPLQPYFIESGEAEPLTHDFLLQNPRPDLTETAATISTAERRKLVLDLP